MSFLYNSISSFVSSGATAISALATQAVKTVKNGAEKVVVASAPVLKSFAAGVSHLGNRYTAYMKGASFEETPFHFTPTSFYSFSNSDPLLQMPMQSLPPQPVDQESKPFVLSSFFYPPTPITAHVPLSEEIKHFTQPIALRQILEESLPEQRESAGKSTSEVATTLLADAPLLQSPFKSIQVGPKTVATAEITNRASSTTIPSKSSENNAEAGQFLESSYFSVSAPGVVLPSSLQTSLEKQVFDKILEQKALPKEFHFPGSAPPQNRYAEKTSSDRQPSLSPTWTASLAQAAGTLSKSSRMYGSDSGLKKTLSAHPTRLAEPQLLKKDSLQHHSAPFSTLSSLSLPIHPFASILSNSTAQTPRLSLLNDTTFQERSDAPIKAEKESTENHLDEKSNLDAFDFNPVSSRTPIFTEVNDNFINSTEKSLSQTKSDRGLLLTETERRNAEEAANRINIHIKAELSEETEKKAREQAVLYSQAKASSEAAIQYKSQEEASSRKREEADRKRDEAYRKAYGQTEKQSKYPQREKNPFSFLYRK